MLAENVLNGDVPVADWLELDRSDALPIDVREPDEFASGHIPKGINLPPSHMRARHAELPTTREIWTSCGVGRRAYSATRFLMQHGYRSRTLSGGHTTSQAFNAVGRTP
jgi:rhodanese-related sulfurtransferase